MFKRTPSQLDLASATSQELNSRLLTKRELSEMAWGVRQYSRKLGSMKLRSRIRSIFLLTKIYDAELIQISKELTKWLLDSSEREVKYTVYVDRELKENKKFDAEGIVKQYEDGEKRLKCWDGETCKTRPHTFDFVITLGGDGTVLYASWLFQRVVPPVLSFALGSLGFLTKFDFSEFKETLTGMFADGITVSLRLRFEATIMRSQERKKRVLKRNGEDGVDGEQKEGKENKEEEEEEGDYDEEAQKRDLVEELIGEEKDDEHTHRPDGTWMVLNEVVVDRGPNTSKLFPRLFCVFM